MKILLVKTDFIKQFENLNGIKNSFKLTKVLKKYNNIHGNGLVKVTATF